jgi:uncharacterized OsmC-like protein
MIAKTKIEKESGNSKIKRIHFEGVSEPARMGVRGGVAEFFKLTPDEPLPSTLEYVAGAIGACLTGTLAGALEARGLDATGAHLEAGTEATIEEIDGKLLLTSVKVHYRIRAPKEKHEAVERALEIHEARCPVSESVRRGITIECSGEIVDE